MMNTTTDRRDEANFPMRAALMRLRLIEDKSAPAWFTLKARCVNCGLFQVWLFQE